MTGIMIVRQRPNDDVSVFKQEVACVNWNQVHKEQFLSSSWDASIKIWTPFRSNPILTLSEHSASVYCAVWHPRHDRTVASGSGDHCVKLWDTACPTGRAQASFKAHDHDVLCLDFSKYNPFELVTGGADSAIHLWDTRRTDRPFKTLVGHTYAVRQVKCDPYTSGSLLSSGLDMNVIYWNTCEKLPLVRRFDHHFEFVLGCNFSFFHPKVVASVSWDRQLYAWNMTGASPASHTESSFRRK